MKDFAVVVDPSVLSGTLQAPPSKSMMIRALAGAWLAGGTTRILHPAACRDALDIAQALSDHGTVVTRDKSFWEVHGGIPLPSEAVFDVGESGLGARMFIPLVARYPYKVTVTGSGSLLRRPMQMVEEPLNRLGASVKTSNSFLPVTVQGPLTGGEITVDGSQGSQFVTGLLMTLPLLEKTSMLRVREIKSRPYIDLTLQVLKDFNISIDEETPNLFVVRGGQKYIPGDIMVEGDWSGAAFLLVAGAIAGDVTLTGLTMDSRQADRKILEVLQQAGVKVVVDGDNLVVQKSMITAFCFDITHCPDLAPPLVALASFAKGESVLSGAERLLTKESNRASALIQEAANLGITIIQKGDNLHILGGIVRGGTACAHNDHRIAMTAAIMGLGASSPVKIEDAACVDKSFPGFFEDIKKIGGQVHESIR